LKELEESGEYEVFNFSQYHAVGWNSIQNKAPMFGGTAYQSLAVYPPQGLSEFSSL
jgi:hypothetical protein